MAAKTAKRKTTQAQSKAQRAKTPQKRTVAKKRPGTKKRTTTGAITVKLDPQLRIGQAADLKARLDKLPGEKNRIRVDGSTVEKIDTSALQLLTAFFIKARNESIDIEWRSPTEPLVSAAELLGLGETLRLSDQKTPTKQHQS